MKLDASPIMSSSGFDGHHCKLNNAVTINMLPYFHKRMNPGILLTRDERTRNMSSLFRTDSK